MKKILSSSKVFLLLLLLAPASVLAQSGLDDRFSISLGAFITDRDTDTRLDSDVLGKGTVIDFEDDLGLDSSDTVFRIDGHYRFGQKHRINFSVFDLSRDSSTTVQREIQFGDEVFSINTVIKADFDLNIYQLAYTYSFLWRENGYKERYCSSRPTSELVLLCSPVLCTLSPGPALNEAKHLSTDGVFRMH